uniref:Glycoside hydrolase family 28 n=1 Tax=Peruphasma schultei TaxID=614134 RepID=A0A191XT24_9NEOP|nr:glycoside hydrolase family 28 [Peruphasma schultei]
MKMEQHSLILSAAFVVLVLIQTGSGRDLRNVTEPKIPPSCIKLKGSGVDDTKTIQTALDTCSKGKAVELSSGTFQSGPLTIPSGVGLHVQEGVTLRASTTAALYDMGDNLCGTIDDLGLGCKPFITILRATGSGIYGKGVIDGRGGSRMTGSNLTWWHLARQAVTVRKLQNNPRLIQINDSVDITVYQITLINAPFYHLTTSETYGFTVWGITINAPGSALNTDGIDPVGSQNVTIAYCNVTTGDDNVGIKALTAPSRYTSVFNNYFGHGNGISIGSETNFGVSEVTVYNLTTINTHNGIRIKSNTFRGGLVTNVLFENVCINNVQWPIYLDTRYYHMTGSGMPIFRNITIRNVKVLTNGTFIFHGFSQSNPIEVTLDDVHIKEGFKFSEHYTKITGSFAEDVSGSQCGTFGNE